MAPSLAAMNNTHRYLSWKHQPSCYGEEEPLPSLPIMYSILEISHEKQERCKHDVVDEMCMMYCKTESSYMEEISLSHHRKKILCITIWVPSFDDGQHGMDLHGMWINVEKKKKKSSRSQVYKGQKDSVGNACQAVGNTGFLSITNWEEAASPVAVPQPYL